MSQIICPEVEIDEFRRASRRTSLPIRHSPEDLEMLEDEAQELLRRVASRTRERNGWTTIGSFFRRRFFNAEWKAKSDIVIDSLEEVVKVKHTCKNLYLYFI